MPRRPRKWIIHIAPDGAPPPTRTLIRVVANAATRALRLGLIPAGGVTSDTSARPPGSAPSARAALGSAPTVEHREAGGPTEPPVPTSSRAMNHDAPVS